MLVEDNNQGSNDRGDHDKNFRDVECPSVVGQQSCVVHTITTTYLVSETSGEGERGLRKKKHLCSSFTDSKTKSV